MARDGMAINTYKKNELKVTLETVQGFVENFYSYWLISWV